MDRKLTELYEDYAQGKINRRVFLRKLTVLAGGAAAAWTLLPLLETNRAAAEVVAKDDARLQSESIKYSGATGEVKAYWSRPKGREKLPGVVVIHENRGLNDHIEDVARRVALEGYLAMAPDALSPLGGTPSDANAAVEMIGKLDQNKTIENFVAAVKFLKTHPQSTGKVGVVGFCWGGAMANQVAVHSPEPAAVAPYYGRQPATADAPKIKAALLLHYAGLDERINAGIPEYEAALKAAGVEYQTFVYEGAKHAFNNDTSPDRYHREAAELAWQRTMSFFKKKLKTP
ncbi:MAG: dienelactone hydrolase family protein [Thermodesulfobacteriota bacterium]